MKNINTIDGLSNIIDQYDVFILDQWGVMHNGHNGYTHAIRCVEKLYQEKKNMIIISNSSKRKETTIKGLSKLGYNSEHFIEVITSGEMIWQSLVNKSYPFTSKLKKNCYHIYNQSMSDGRSFTKGLEDFNFVNNIKEANFILACTPFVEFNTIDYVPLLTEAIEKKLPFICANPDFETVKNNSNKLEICMGTIAELYKSLGGEIFMLGKPKIDIYIESTKKILNLDKSRVLAIGDSINHDIQGAKIFGVDSLLITSGIHQSFFDRDRSKWKKNIYQINSLGILPTFLCSKFQI